MKIRVQMGQHNTGCERRVREVILEITQGELDFGTAEACLVISHLPQPRFTTISVELEVPETPEEAIVSSVVTGRFELSLEEVRNDGWAEVIAGKWFALVADLKKLMEKTNAQG